MKKLTNNSDDEKRVLVRASLLCGVLFVLDIVSKVVVIENITFGGKVVVIPEFFNLTYVLNPGAAFGLFPGQGWFLLVISVVVMSIVIRFFRHLAEGYSERYYALMMILSGIIGNSVDRVWHRKVVDFLDFYVSAEYFPSLASLMSDMTIFGYRVFGSNHWPAFNVADSAISVGISIFIISTFLRPQQPCSGDDNPDSCSEEEEVLTPPPPSTT